MQADLSGLLDRVVEAVVGAVRPGIETAEIECARRKPRSDLRASDLVLRALPFVLASDPTSAQVALGPLEEAMALDPDDPRPVALAAWCRTQLVVYGRTGSSSEARRQATSLADRAGALDPLADPLVLTARSGALMGAGRLAEAKDLLARAAAMDPSFGWVWGAHRLDKIAHRAWRSHARLPPTCRCVEGVRTRRSQIA